MLLSNRKLKKFILNRDINDLDSKYEIHEALNRIREKLDRVCDCLYVVDKSDERVEHWKKHGRLYTRALNRLIDSDIVLTLYNHDTRYREDKFGDIRLAVYIISRFAVMSACPVPYTQPILAYL